MFLDPQLIARLESFSVRAKVVADGALSGLHRASDRGSSVEFAEYKEYSPGDEIRHIDWRVYGKADRYVIRQFELESQLTSQLVLDSSASMAYKSEEGLSKLEYAAYLLGALAYLFIRQRDKAGLLVFGDRAVERYVPPRARASHGRDLLAVIDSVLQSGAAGDESAAEAIERTAEITARRRQMVVIASDFFDHELRRSLAALEWLRARGHDVVVFHILHPDELGLPFDGLSKFVDFESSRELLASPRAIRRDYMEKLKAFTQTVSETCVAAGVEYRAVRTDAVLENVLASFLAGRSGETREHVEAQWSF